MAIIYVLKNHWHKQVDLQEISKWICKKVYVLKNLRRNQFSAKIESSGSTNTGAKGCKNRRVVKYKNKNE
jgi:hypothetical protein